LTDEPIDLDADPVRLAQVVVNLVDNAVKYTPAGGRITVTLDREGGHAVLRVRDTGIGISAEERAGIFRPFAQSRRSSERSAGGLGIGLALSRGLVVAHGGTLTVSSEGPGRGSEFIVRLPAAAPLEAMPASAWVTPVAGIPSARFDTPVSLRILVVDDVVDAAETLAHVLRLLGDIVHVAHDGRAALELADHHSPDVVFVDLQMPEIDGIEVARRLRKRAEFKEVMLVAMTGFGQPEDRRQTAEAGFDHHLTKPLDPSVLRRLLATRRRNEASAVAAE